MSRTERQDELVETHRAVHEEGLPYVLVGGWAISAYQTRFTTDIDLVIPSEGLGEYEQLLADRGYSKELESDVSGIYEGRIVRFEKSVGDNSVEFDALIDAVRCRQTDAEWSYRHLHEHSTVESLEVAAGPEARIPEPALLFALKLHSGRRADTRDLVVLSTQTDFDCIERHVHRGDEDALDEQIGRVLERLESDGFEDAFKGVFEQQTVPVEAIEELATSLRRLRD